jgi:formylglycine-generating enzyme required for sulfatase activity
MEAATNSQQDDKSVVLSNYAIGETEVTQELWQAVMQHNPANYRGSAHNPVEYVSWNECQKFITMLNRLTGANFRLPTEAEWEYAARGGQESKGYRYSGSNTVGNVAWYISNSSVTTHPVKSKSPNELGLYDMSGNVSEWCDDRYYGDSSQSEETAMEDRFIFRGGSWSDNDVACRVSMRAKAVARQKKSNRGLRLALTL